MGLIHAVDLARAQELVAVRIMVKLLSSHVIFYNLSSSTVELDQDVYTAPISST